MWTPLVRSSTHPLKTRGRRGRVAVRFTAGVSVSRQPDARSQTDGRTQRQPAQLRRAAIDVRSVTMWFVSGTAAPAAGQHSLDGGGRQASRRQLADYESLWRRF